MPIREVNFAYMKNIIFLKSYRAGWWRAGPGAGRGQKIIKGSKKPHINVGLNLLS